VLTVWLLLAVASDVNKDIHLKAKPRTSPPRPRLSTMKTKATGARPRPERPSLKTAVVYTVVTDIIR